MKLIKNMLILFVLLSSTFLLNAEVKTAISFSPTSTSNLSYKHPLIWASYTDRQRIIDNIQQYEWANSLFMQLKNRVDAQVDIHKINPTLILNEIPAIPDNKGERSNHNNILTSASEAAILYYLTDDKKYAQYAADILNHYNERLSVLEAKKYISASSGLFFNDWWLESRALFPKIAIVYDFVYNYVNNPATTVFDVATSLRKPFDHTAAQKTAETLATVIFKSISAQNCNHSVLAGNGALFNLLMIENDAKRDEFFNYFYNDPLKFPFDAYTWTLNNFTSQNIWDETISYSKGSHYLILQTLDIIDRYKPELDIITKNKRILEGYSFYENYKYPSGEGTRFGDAGNIDLLDGYELILHIATRKNMPEFIAKTKQSLKFEYDKRGGRNPQLETTKLEWSDPLLLLGAENVEDTIMPKAPVLATNTPVEHAGLVIQRNYNTPDVKTNGMMLYSGGATYVHAHSTGIDMVLYGKGQVFGAEGGSGTYLTDEHVNYRVKLAAHNTVIANGSGISGSNWNTRMSKVNLLACEPKVYETPITSDFSFTTQYIDDTYNNCLQQRTNSIIRTSPTTAYYFDIFRSKGKKVNNYHDYIYHNIGDTLELKFADNTIVPLRATEKYATDIAGSKTGWRFFKQVVSSTATNKAIEATFALNTVNKKMYAFLPSGINREYVTAKVLYTKGALHGYDKKYTPVMAVRQYGEAWNKAFVAVFEPAEQNTKSVKSVTNIFSEGKVVGAVVVSEVDGSKITDYILSNDNDSVSLNLNMLKIKFQGRFGIVRTVVKDRKTDVSLYIGQGQKITFFDKELMADSEQKGFIKF